MSFNYSFSDQSNTATRASAPWSAVQSRYDLSPSPPPLPTSGIDLDDYMDYDDKKQDIPINMNNGFNDEEDDNDEREMGEGSDMKRLMKAWVAERCAPGILKWEDDLVDGLMWRVEQQKEMVSTLLSEDSTSEEEHFKLMLVQTEMERAKFLLRSYLRTRLSKIEKYAQMITITPTVQPLLSPLELKHARKFYALVASHFKLSVLDSLPDRMGDLEEVQSDGLSMVAKPNPTTAVFIYCRRDIGPQRLPSFGSDKPVSL
ncbi:Predicted alpha-helical protein, potentially involved in replication/repair [Phaffia rhodozyma]|uniref:Predicted alpha-helical protein, potentially involved in replication/repair n=1 Tax=Phaffia rhodozyma TaxID=264483 RepID=A0A0F7SSQ6_PHARH|nr:Predicted alpha-helical protein, potentially involved in replication/repair [Phaffia rhodozyma]